MTSPPFMSIDAGAGRGGVVEPPEALERAVGLEHGVEVADEHHLEAVRMLLAVVPRPGVPPGPMRRPRPSGRGSGSASSSSANEPRPRRARRAWFDVPLLMFTARSGSASDTGSRRSTACASLPLGLAESGGGGSEPSRAAVVAAGSAHARQQATRTGRRASFAHHARARRIPSRRGAPREHHGLHATRPDASREPDSPAAASSCSSSARQAPSSGCQRATRS